MSDSKDSNRPDVFQRVTDQLLEAMEAGRIPWRKPWTDLGAHRNVLTGHAYNGVNTLLLQVRALVSEYEYPLWLTLRQANQLGGRIRKGEKSQEIIFAQRKEVAAGATAAPQDEETADTGAAQQGRARPRVRFVWRSFRVFNVAQVDGIAFAVPKPARVNDPIEAAEALWRGYAAAPKVVHQGGRAFYRPATDTITMPARDWFESPSAYYETLFHEGIHSTGAEHRLNRSTLAQATFFGDQNYSQEELVAEIGACLLMARAGLEPDIQNSAAYLRGWTRRLREDKRLVVMAAKQAEKAALHIAPAPPQPAGPLVVGEEAEAGA